MAKDHNTSTEQLSRNIRALYDAPIADLKNSSAAWLLFLQRYGHEIEHQLNKSTNADDTLANLQRFMGFISEDIAQEYDPNFLAALDNSWPEIIRAYDANSVRSHERVKAPQPDTSEIPAFMTQNARSTTPSRGFFQKTHDFAQRVDHTYVRARNLTAAITINAIYAAVSIGAVDLAINGTESSHTAQTIKSAVNSLPQTPN